MHTIINFGTMHASFLVFLIYGSSNVLASQEREIWIFQGSLLLISGKQTVQQSNPRASSLAILRLGHRLGQSRRHATGTSVSILAAGGQGRGG